MRLTDIKTVKTIMAENGLHFQKKFGQNFLINPLVPERISSECGADADSGIIEIGPGIGTMTQYLCDIYKKVVAIEIDRELIPVLGQTLADCRNVTVINEDILHLDLQALCREHFDGMPVSVCANLPYYITTPIIMALFEQHIPVDNITVMVQKEVADRLCALPGSADYGAITAVVNYYAEPERLFRVGRNNFMPVPNVDSTVVRLKLHKNPPVDVRNEALFFRVIKASFAQRRKTLVNALSAGFSELPKSVIADIPVHFDLPTNIRGERLGIEQFAEIANYMSELMEK